jgi:hypothetical protein
LYGAVPARHHYPLPAQKAAGSTRCATLILEWVLQQLGVWIFRSRYPTATFDVAPDMDDPDITILWTTVDGDDLDEVLDLVSERQLHWQIEEGVPVYVVPIRTPERRATLWREQPPPR